MTGAYSVLSHNNFYSSLQITAFPQSKSKVSFMEYLKEAEQTAFRFSSARVANAIKSEKNAARLEKRGKTKDELIAKSLLIAEQFMEGWAEKEIKQKEKDKWTPEAVQAAKRKVKYLISNNLSGSVYFVTLTFRGKAPSFADGLRELQRFERRLNIKYNGKVKIIAVPELGKKKGRLHFHAVITGCRIDYGYAHKKLWKAGNIDFKTVKGYRSASVMPIIVSYITKYISKDCQRIKGQNRIYYASHNIDKRIRKSIMSFDQVKDLMRKVDKKKSGLKIFKKVKKITIGEKKTPVYLINLSIYGDLELRKKEADAMLGVKWDDVISGKRRNYEAIKEMQWIIYEIAKNEDVTKVRAKKIKRLEELHNVIFPKGNFFEFFIKLTEFMENTPLMPVVPVLIQDKNYEMFLREPLDLIENACAFESYRVWDNSTEEMIKALAAEALKDE